VPLVLQGDAFDTSILDQLDGTLGGVDFKA